MNPKLTIKILLWLIAAVTLFHLTILIKIIPFGLNTLGNIFAETLYEKSLSLLTLVFTFLLWNILKKSNKDIKARTK